MEDQWTSEERVTCAIDDEQLQVLCFIFIFHIPQKGLTALTDLTALTELLFGLFRLQIANRI